MATKPTETLNFEPTAAVAIPSGKQTVGFLPGEKPPAQYLSWLFRTLSRLYNYVVDGNFAGNHTITGALGVSGLLTASDGIAVPTGKSVNIAGTSTLSVGTGATALGGILGAAGAITSGSDVIVSGTARHRHGSRDIPLHSSLFYPDTSAVAAGATLHILDYWTNGASFPVPSTFKCPIVIESGKTITHYTQGYDVAGTANTISFSIKRRSLATNAVTTVSGSGLSANLGNGYAAITATPNHVVEAGYAYFIECVVVNPLHRIHSAGLSYID
jgi:hypothetical protein